MIKGVNLGGWLVVERWITPSLFEGLNAVDEYSLCEELGENKDERLDAHHKTFITYDDFKWIREHGFDAVRIPVPHWVFGDVEPYVGCAEYLDLAFEGALEHGLQVILDLHTAPGSQNGEDHSGHKGEITWHTDPANIEKTLAVIERLCKRYDGSPALIAIELLNEPSSKIPHDILTGFYKRGYELVRKYFSESVAVIASDAFRPMDWKGVFDENYKNIILDLHLYQVFSRDDRKMSMHRHIQKALREWKDLIYQVQQNIPVLVGEWSVALDRQALRGHDAYERDLAMKAYAAAQLKAFEDSAGWCYWTYKTEAADAWSARDSIWRGWLHIAN
jgi:glucan 1,3-beta-glucosidase